MQLWAVRQQRPCLACVRRANGRQHRPGCDRPDDLGHPGRCHVPGEDE